MNLDSLSNNIPNQDHVTSSSSGHFKTKSGVFSLDLGNLKAISEQIEASSASKILHTEDLIEESSKSLRGVSAPLDHIGDERINSDYLDSDLETKDFESEDIDLDDEDLLNELLEEELMVDFEEEIANIEEEGANIEEEKVAIKEETADNVENEANIEEETAIIENEAANEEKELVNVEEHLARKEIDVENQLIVNRDKIDQKSKVNIYEGAEKVFMGKESANQLTSEIEVLDTDNVLRNKIIATIDSEVEQNNVAIDQDKRLIAKDKRTIAEERRAIAEERRAIAEDKKEMEHDKRAIQKKSVAIVKDTGVIRKDTAVIAEGIKTRAENAKKLNELDADKRVDDETVNEAINHRLQSATFDNVRNAKGVLLRDDKESIEELKSGIQAGRQAHPEKDLTKCIEDVINEWFENKDICELDPKGKLVPVTPERRRQLAAILSRGVIKEIGFQVGIAQKTAEKGKAEEKTSDLKAANREEHESIVSLVDGHSLDPQFFNTMYKVVECKFFCLDGIEIKNVNRLEEMNKENIDLIDRIKEMVILKDIIKRDILKTEIEHTEIEHTTTVLDGAKRSITNKIYRFDGQDKENVCLRHPTLHPKVKYL